MSGNVFNGMFHFFGLWNRIFWIEAVSTFKRSPLICTSPKGLFRSQHRLIVHTSSFFSFVFFVLAFSCGFAHIFCKILTDDYKFGYLHFILCSLQPIITLMEEGKVININFFIITSKKRNILICVQKSCSSQLKILLFTKCMKSRNSLTGS